MTNPNPWTPKEERAMRRYYHDMGTCWLAMVTGRTKTSIHEKARRMGLHGKRGSPVRSCDDDTVRAIRQNRRGMTQSQMAEILGICRTTVSRIQSRDTYIRVR